MNDTGFDLRKRATSIPMRKIIHTGNAYSGTRPEITGEPLFISRTKYYRKRSPIYVTCYNDKITLRKKDRKESVELNKR